MPHMGGLFYLRRAVFDGELNLRGCARLRHAAEQAECLLIRGRPEVADLRSESRD
jgi:hypothetical protein